MLPARTPLLCRECGSRCRTLEGFLPPNGCHCGGLLEVDHERLEDDRWLAELEEVLEDVAAVSSVPSSPATSSPGDDVVDG